MREILFTGPAAYSGDGEYGQWCAVCAMLFKQAVIETPEGRAAVSEVQSGAPGPDVPVDMTALARKHKIKFPRTADVTSPARLLGGAVVPTCWAHVTALSMSSVLPATELPAGSVPLLGQRR